MKDADDAFSPERTRQRATQHKRGETKSEKESPITARNVESSTAASKAAALCDDAQACKRMRQGAMEHNRGETKTEENNTNQNAANRLLTASFEESRRRIYVCVLASLQAHVSENTTTQKRGNKQRGENAIQNAVKRLLTASFDITQITHTCVLLSAPHSRPP